MKTAASILAGLLLAAVTAPAQLAPLHVGSEQPLYDEFGQLLRGTDPGSDQFGQPVIEGDLVHILRADAGVVNPPSTNGAPDAANPLISTTRIGMGVDPGLGPSGLFGASLTTLSRFGSTPVRLVARVFNAPTLEQASFYVDSELYDAPIESGGKYGVFVPTFTNTATAIPLDTTDHDGDGLIRSWEISYGANPDNPDSDGDGMADGHEIRAGTGVTDPASLLVMVQILAPGEGGTWNEEEGMYSERPTDLNLSWDAVAGKTYQLEFTTNDLSAAEVLFTDVNPSVTATGPVASTVITNGLLLDATHFRVRLVE